jgi:glycosyltransferase
MSTKYKCAVITPLLNSNEIVRATYESLAQQLSADLCWFVKNSGVDSANVLDFAKGKEHIFYVEKPDSSLYEAINQALALVDADYYVVLGAGDRLSVHAGALILGCIEQLTGKDAFFFAAKRYPIDLTVLPRPEFLTAFMSTPHAGALLKVENSREIGGYDVRYKIAADYDHLCRYTKMFPMCGKNNFVLTHYLGGGISEQRLLEGYIECCLVRLRVCNTSQESETLAMQRDLRGFVGSAFVA